MRRYFRLIGLVRFIVGAIVVALAIAFDDTLGEAWSGFFVLLGAAVGVSGMASVLLLIAYYLIFPFLYIGIIWLVTDIWDGSYYSDTLRKNYGYLYFFWASGLLALPLIFYYQNKSWFFMIKNFALSEKPSDTPHPELFATGVVDLTGSPYLAAVTFTEQGIILDRRNFGPVILPWRWITSVKRDGEADPRFPSAVVALRNDDNQFLTLSVPWNEELLDFKTGRLKET